MKVLKLAFSMGGGVSLGTFSGSALTEAIKLSVLNAIEGNAGYDKVEIDVFSGASAGSLSLAVMLRALSWRTQEEEEAAESTLINKYPAQWANANPEQKQDLIAAQVAQDLQQRAWVELVTLDELLGGDGPDREKRKLAMKSSAGLLDSRAIHKIAQDLIIPPEDQGGIIWNRRLLAVRCLYACALTSLTPFRADGRTPTPPGNPWPPGLEDALTSRYHNDLRVFDLHLDPDHPLTEQDLDRAESHAVSFAYEPLKEYPAPSLPPRWYRLHDGPNLNKVGVWKARESWAVIAATAIASGAFPGAFDPVVLRRLAWEYGWEESRRSGDDKAKTVNEKSAWPKLFQKRKITEHPFAYIDGGVFNNEPLREAYRMASFLDCRADAGTFQRCVLFVDPSVGPEDDNLRVPALREFSSGEKRLLNVWSPSAGERRPTLARLMSLVGNLVDVLIHQGRCREADKVAAVRDSFELRRAFRRSTATLVNTIVPATADTLRADLLAGCADLLASWAEAMIPPGEGTQADELKRVIHEERAGSPRLKNAQHYLDAAEAYVDTGFPDPGNPTECQTWVWLHLAVYFDLALELDGKRESTGLVAITPYQPAATVTGLAPLKLLGDPLGAFAGFLSKGARKHDFDAGRYCAGLFLKRAEKIRNHVPSLALPLQQPGQNEYRQNLSDGVERLKARLAEVVNDVIAPLPAGPVLGLIGINNIISANIEEIAQERYAPPDSTPWQRVEFELFILIPAGSNLEIDAPGPQDRDSPARRVILGKTVRSALATALTYDTRTGWEGGALHDSGDGARIYIDEPGLHLGHWAILPVPTAQQSIKLLDKAASHLRPVLVVDLDRGARPTPDNNVIDSSRWDVSEAAVPLDYCLLTDCKGL